MLRLSFAVILLAIMVLVVLAAAIAEMAAGIDP